MTSLPHSFANSVPVSVSHQKHGDCMRKNLTYFEDDNVSSSRKAFASLLWRAFPSPSENDLATKAAKVLEVSPRQVKNWLRYQNSAAIHYFFIVAAIAGAEVILRDGGKL